jgi:hypothetical protein
MVFAFNKPSPPIRTAQLRAGYEEHDDMEDTAPRLAGSPKGRPVQGTATYINLRSNSVRITTHFTLHNRSTTVFGAPTQLCTKAS